MWLTIGLLIICFTIIVMFRMYMDLRRQDQQHVRLTQGDQRNHEKYMRITRQEAIGEMTKVLTDLKEGKVTLDPAPKQQEGPDIRALGEEPPQMTPYKKAWIDPRTIGDMQQIEYDAFIQREQREARKRHYR